MKKVLAFICVFAAVTAAVLWQIFTDSENYYLISVAIIFLLMIPFFADFEKGANHAGEIALTAGLIAIAVVSRAAFYLIPQVKPIAAVVIISGVCLGAKRGCFIGAMSAFVSNFIFGQGVWTPFQMAALGTVGLLSGIIFSKVKAKKIPLAIIGFVLVFVFYALIADLSTVLFMTSDYSLASVLAVYMSGVAFNLVFAVTTSVCLLLFGEAFIKKINRIVRKYGVLSEQNPL